MKNISQAVEKALKTLTGQDIPDLNYSLSSSLELRLLTPADAEKSYKKAKKKFLRSYLSDLLTLSLGNISLAAKKANVHRRHLHRIILELNIDPASYRKDLIKPSEYMKENITHILESKLSDGGDMHEKYRSLYPSIEDISEQIAKDMDSTFSYDEALELFEKEFLSKALKKHGYDIAKTAEDIDMNERTLYRKVSKLNIAEPQAIQE